LSVKTFSDGSTTSKTQDQLVDEMIPDEVDEGAALLAA